MTFMYIPYDPPYCADEDGCGSGPVDLSNYEGFVSLTAPEAGGTISFATGIEGGTQILMQSGNIGITGGSNEFGQLNLEAETIGLDSQEVMVTTGALTVGVGEAFDQTPGQINLIATDTNTYASLGLYETGNCVLSGDGTITIVSPGITICTNTTQALGFHGANPIPQQTGVAVTAEASHAALVALGLIAA